MATLPREQLEDFVQRWLDVNREAERNGDWTPLADFYADDATYGWNIGPKEDVMCVGKDEIREIALGLEMAGLQGWTYPYQRCSSTTGSAKSSASGSRWPPTRTGRAGRSTESAVAGSGSPPPETVGSSSNGNATSSTSATSRSCIWN